MAETLANLIQSGASIRSTLNIVTYNTQLYSKTITVTNNEGTIVGSGVMSSSGTASVAVNELGELTIACGSYTKNITIFKNKSEVTVNLYYKYGYKIQKSNSNPATRVTPISGCDNESYTNFTMNMSTGVPNYGSWKDAFFMPKPCMLKKNGTVNYYLNPDDYTKKADGTTADITDSSGTGDNAMMQWPRIYTYRYEDSTYQYCYISDSPINSNYKCWTHYAQDNTLAHYVYSAIYMGSIKNSVLRSISGASEDDNDTTTVERTDAHNNGDGWEISTFAQRMMINDLLVLMGMSTDTQSVYGQGHTTGGSSASDLLKTGLLNDKGLFYGSSSTTVGVKVFGMEQYWGDRWTRLVGWLNVSGTQKVKLTYGTIDGSTVTGYNETGDGYIALSGVTPSGSSGGYISKTLMTQYGMIPYTASGSSSTYECDGMWFNNGQTDLALVGGDCYRGALCGAFAVDLDGAAGRSTWFYGASLSYTPVTAN